MTADQLELISTDPRVMHGQAVIAGTRVPVSVILDCIAAGMTAEQITAEYPTVTAAGARAAAYGAVRFRKGAPRSEAFFDTEPVSSPSGIPAEGTGQRLS